MSSADHQRHVLVLDTGGTIGMTKDDEGALIPKFGVFSKEVAENPRLNDNVYAKKCEQNYKGFDKTYALPLGSDYKRVLYYIKEYKPPIDSSQIKLENWKTMAEDVKHYYGDFDGFVIIHGTDTMAYTSATLSFMLENLGKPVILTGAQIPLQEIGSDGWDNLLGALSFAGLYVIPEVTLFFDKKLFRGNRVTKIDCNKFKAFDSPNFEPLATMEPSLSGAAFSVNWCNMLKKTKDEFKVDTDLSPKVGLLKLYPGITIENVTSFLNEDHGLKGVVLQTYGVGGSPTTFLDVLSKAVKENGVLILNCTQCIKGTVLPTYKVGKDLEKAGLIPGADINGEAALAKLRYVLCKSKLNNEQMTKMMKRNLRGEITLLTA